MTSFIDFVSDHYGEKLQSETVDEYLKAHFIGLDRFHEEMRPYGVSEPASLTEGVNASDLLQNDTLLSSSRIEIQTKGINQTISGYKIATSNVRTSQSSTSVTRNPAQFGSSVQGSRSNLPFEPGGIINDISKGKATLTVQNNGSGRRTLAPGFSKGVEFLDESKTDWEMPWLESICGHLDANPFKDVQHQDTGEIAIEEPSDPLDTILGTESDDNVSAPVVKRAVKAQTKQDTSWAHIVDLKYGVSNFEELVPSPAKTYSFKLDTFQQEAIVQLENGNSVFVAAHTSAGKTVVAEYAIAMSLKHMTRTIYTSPIKALSNQKFRDFQDTFGAENVGILTGDVQLNPDAPCLIMTTEILRSMLYKGADLIRDVEWVIFDEVHYVNDSERGVVWEEVIILLPAHVNMILLSATVPNTAEFAGWIGRTKKKHIYVISTTRRPVPLEHHIYVDKKMFPVVDKERKFNSRGFRDAFERIKIARGESSGGSSGPSRGGSSSGRGGAPSRGGAGRGGRGGPSFKVGDSSQVAASAAFAKREINAATKGPGNNDAGRQASLWGPLANMLRREKYLPVVVFSFSKAQCETYADSLPNIQFGTASEQSEIHLVIEKSLARLSPEDRKLPQLTILRERLMRGIGVHHGGLLPIVKEIVEILFARGLVKLLFATETFAMGVNMPAKSVVFASLGKHDGKSFRDLLPGEYTQMSGRAGRRGLDEKGLVIVLGTEMRSFPTEGRIQKIMLGTPTKLESQFRLTYTMILNLLRVEALRVEEMIKRSFSENATQVSMPEREQKLIQVQHELKNLPPVTKESLVNLYSSARSYFRAARELAQYTGWYDVSLALRVKYVILFCNSSRYYEPAIPLSAVRVPAKDPEAKRIFVLAAAKPQRYGSKAQIPLSWPPTYAHLDTFKEKLAPMSISVKDVVFVSRLSLQKAFTEYEQTLDDKSREQFRWLMSGRMVAKDLPSLNDAIMSGIYEKKAAGSSRNKQSDQSPLPRPVVRKKWDAELLDAKTALDDTEQAFAAQSKQYGPVLAEDFEQTSILEKKAALEDQAEDLKNQLTEEVNLELLPDYQGRINVLKELGYVNDNMTVTLKGRVACEVNTVDALILTELVFENTFANFEPEAVCALLSAFIYDARQTSDEELIHDLQSGREALESVVTRVDAVKNKHRADITSGASDERSADNPLNFTLANVVYEWARGVSFYEITQMTEVQEGSIVRCITRLDETCREMRDAARVVGNADLSAKMEECQLRIRRDIVFCASLYF